MNKIISIEKSDEKILKEYRNSADTKEYAALYKRYMTLIYGLCLKYLKEREDAQDMVMEIYEKTSTLLIDTEVTHFKSWLYQVSKNQCLMKLRAEKSAKNIIPFMESVHEIHLYDVEEPIDVDISKLEHCIDKLKEKQKLCVSLFYLKGKSYAQITETTDYEVKQVKSYIQNAKRNLKICIEAYG